MQASHHNSTPLVIIPTYNEAENIEVIIKTIFELPKNFHVLVVDDTSPDNTQEIVQNLIKIYQSGLYLMSRNKKLGLGTAYVAGFQFALQKGYTHMLQMDADFSHDPQDLIKLHGTCVQEGYDLVVGSRYINGINVVNWPIKRVLLSYISNLFVCWITGMPIKDTTAGFTCYTKEVLKAIDLDKIQLQGYGFQVAIKFLTWKYGFKIKEIPIVFTNRVKGVSKMSKKIIKEAIFGIIRMKVNSFFTTYHRQ